MADNYEFRKALVGVDHQRDLEVVYLAQVNGLTRQDLADSLDFYYGGDLSLYEHVLELFDEAQGN